MTTFVAERINTEWAREHLEAYDVFAWETPAELKVGGAVAKQVDLLAKEGLDDDDEDEDVPPYTDLVEALNDGDEDDEKDEEEEKE